MNLLNSQKLNFLTYVLPILLLVSVASLSPTDWVKDNPDIYIGITYDLIITVPILFFILNRKSRLKYFTGLFIGSGFLIGYLVIPESEKYHFDILRFYTLPLIELGIFSTVIYFTVRTVRKLRKASSSQNVDYLSILQQSGITALKNVKAGKIFGSEFGMLYYALFCWQNHEIKQNEYSYHKKSGIISLVVVLIFVLLAESIGIHFLVSLWSTIAAWILTCVSIYALLFFLGHMKAVIHRPHVIVDDQVHVKNGIFNGAKIPIDKIDRIDKTGSRIDLKVNKAVKLTPLGNINQHNIILYLKDQVDVEYMYGIRRKYGTLMISVDDPNMFIKKINETTLVNN